ncbi:MAG: plasmid mobilization relaxosome protein MobC [Clostridia bacterium]|nr:plasmid mobilization relaxosome protein MobC [Clostridia bacterium]
MRSFRPLRSCGELTAFPNFTAFAVASRAHGYPPLHTNAGVPAPPYEITERRPQKLRTRNISVPFRVTEKELQEIDRKAAKAKLSRTVYLIACALGKQITLVEDLKPLLAEMRRIGNNINQLTKLANMGKIRETNLTEAKETLEQIYVAIYSLARGGDKHWQSS